MKNIILLMAVLYLTACANSTPQLSNTITQIEALQKELKQYPIGTKGHADCARKIDSLLKWEDEHTGMKGLRNKQIQDSLSNLKK